MKRERTPVRLFVIAAAADAAYQAALEKHLVPLWQQGLLEHWQSVQPGEDVEEAFAEARLILLLLSADFNADSLCQEQMQRALERECEGEVKVLPILLRPVEVTDAPFAHLQMVPTSERAVTLWEVQDAAWTHITEAIRCVLEGKPLSQVEVQKDEGRYRTENQQASYGQTIGEHNEIHQHFYFSERSPPTPIMLPRKPIWMVSSAGNPFFIECKEAFARAHLSRQKRHQGNQKKLKKRGFSLFIVTLIYVTFLISSSSLLAEGERSKIEVSDTPLALSEAVEQSSALLLSGSSSEFYATKIPAQRFDDPKASVPYQITIQVHNLRRDVDLFIDDISLILEKATLPPYPLQVESRLADGMSYPGNYYRALYLGQKAKAVLGTVSIPQPTAASIAFPPSVSRSRSHIQVLADGTVDSLTIAIYSPLSIDLQFHVQITYHVGKEEKARVFIWSHLYEVIFSDVLNWQHYHLQGSIYIKDS